MVRNVWAVVVSVVTAVVLIGGAIVPAASASEACSNEARRVEQASTFLPDCRAYELVTPSSNAPSSTHLKYFAGEPELLGTFVNLAEFGGKYEPIRLTPTERYRTAGSGGNTFLFESEEQPGPSLALCGCMSRRTSSGWVGEDPLPRISSVTIFCLGSAGIAGYSADLEELVVGVGGLGERCAHAEPPLVAGEPGEFDSNQQNLFVRDKNGSYQLLDMAPPGVVPKTRLAAVSADGSHVLFESTSPLTPDTPSGGVTNIYVWSAPDPHSLQLLTVLPDGTAVHGPGVGGAYLATPFNTSGKGRTALQIEEEVMIRIQTGVNQSAEANHAISSNGERVVFYDSSGGLYLREHPAAEQSAAGECTEAEQKAEPEKACTIQIDIAQGGSGQNGHGQFQWASADTSKIFFTDEEKLTSGSTAQAGKPDLYEYDVEKPEGQRVVDLTANASEPADVRGVSGASEDGSYLYFVARGELTGAQQNSHGESALAPAGGTGSLTSGSTEVTGVSTTSGAFHVGMAITGTGIPVAAWITAVGAGTLTLSQPAGESGTQALSAEAGNLYLRHGGTTTFIAALNPRSPDACDFRMACLSARVSENGQFIAFNSVSSLTGYDNNPVRPNACRVEPVAWPCIEIFRYAATSGANGELTCVSCHPDGSPPAAEFAYADIEQAEQGAIGIASTFIFRMNQNVSDSGQVFFSTMEKLAPADENETWDAYEYEGGEGMSAQLHLISSGKSPEPSYFEDATADGSNVFFVTAQSLLRSDTRADYDVYDARVGGGFTAQDEGVASPPCEALEACRSPLTEPPAEFSAASATLSGAGNLVSPLPPSVLPTPKKTTRKPIKCRKGQKLSHGKCGKPIKCRKGKKLSHGKCVKKKPKRSKAKKSTRPRGSK